jgi:hypothetical protein
MKLGENFEEVSSVPRVARLQFEAVRHVHDTYGEGWQIDYELVLPLITEDCRGTFNQKPNKSRPKNYKLTWLDADNCKRIPLGRSGMYPGGKYPDEFPISFGGLLIPFRNGAHMNWDNEHLKLPTYYLANGKAFRIIAKEKAEQ